MTEEGKEEGESPQPQPPENEPSRPSQQAQAPPPKVEEIDGWGLLSHVKLNDLYLVSKLRSMSTKMELIHAHVPEPHVHCYCIIPHKLEDDLGLPHILQHMIFQGGSTKYPQAGLLQRIASRSYSSPLKSWVERDHSCYHWTTAGKTGCEQVLPVVFDHIFHPILQEATFLQEVYHMEGNGVDHGNCLEEILKIEWDPEALSTIEMIKTAMGPQSGYRFNYAGTSANLREEDLKAVDKVKEFHKKFYHLANCCLVICGDMARPDVLSMLNKMIAEGGNWSKPKDNWEKPWLSEPIQEPHHEPLMSKIEYPCSNGKRGVYVKIGILGPPSTEKLNRCAAMRLVLEYLVTGPLFQALAIDKTKRAVPAPVFFDDSSICSSLSVSEYEMKHTLFCIDCEDVPLEMVNTVRHAIRRAMEQHLMQDYEFDYDRMVQIVQRFYNDELTSLETTLEEKLCRNILPDYLYATQDSDLMFDRRVNSAYTIHHFLNQPPDFWKHVIHECLLEANWVTIAAIPSKQLEDELMQKEEERQKLRMEPSHIKDTKRIAQRYKAAVKMLATQRNTANNEILDKFQLPPVESIGYTWIARQENPAWAEETLCNLYVDDVNSSYVFLTVIMDTTELTMEEKKHLVLFSEGLLNSPFIDSSDEFHTAEQMEEYLQRDCLAYETFFGLEWMGRLDDRTKFSCGSFPHLFCLRFQLDSTKIREGFYWAQNLLWNTKWQADKLKHTCQKLVLEVDQELKRHGPVMTRAMLTDSLYLMNSTPKAISLIRQKMFLRKIGEDLPKSMRRVSKMLEGIRMTLLRPENCTVHVAGSLSKMEFNLTEDPNARDAIAQLFRQTFDYTGWHWGYDTKRLSNAFDMYVMRSAECIAKCAREQILRMEGVNSCYLVQAAPGIKSWNDADYPMILATLQYFIQTDGGPLHKEIVEKGFAEDIDIRVSPSEGLLYFELRNCEDIAEAYGKAFDVMAKHCSDEALNIEGEGGSNVWDEHLLTSAKSSMIYRLSQEENTPQHVAMLSLLGYYKGVNQLGHLRRHLMGQIAGATLQQVCQMTVKYLRPLFLQPCTCAASVPKEKAIATIQNLMERCGKRLTLIPPVEHSALASYNQ